MAEPIRRYAQTVAAVMFEDTAATGPLKAFYGEWLVREAMRLWPRWSGLRFFQKTNTARSFLIASYHHPARLCWSWSLGIEFTLFRRRAYLWPFNFGYWRDGNWVIRLPYVLELRWSRQRYDWILSSAAKQRLAHIVDSTLGTAERRQVSA